jgi:hypothetical protein
MKSILERSLVLLDRIIRSIWTALHPKGWIVLVTAILLVLMMAMLTCAYVQGSEDRDPAAKHHNDPVEIEMEDGFQKKAVKLPADDPIRAWKNPLIWFKAMISVLAVGVLACVIAHKMLRKRRVKVALVILLTLKIFIVLVCAIEIVMNQ